MSTQEHHPNFSYPLSVRDRMEWPSRYLGGMSASIQTSCQTWDATSSPSQPWYPLSDSHPNLVLETSSSFSSEEQDTRVSILKLVSESSSFSIRGWDKGVFLTDLPFPLPPLSLRSWRVKASSHTDTFTSKSLVSLAISF